jgi:hypothetical protein
METRLIALMGIATVGFALAASCSDDEETSNPGTGNTPNTGGGGSGGSADGGGGSSQGGGGSSQGGGGTGGMASGETCAEAIALTGSGITQGNTTGTTSDYALLSCAMDYTSMGPDLVYSVEVPDGMYMDFGVIPTGFDPVVGLFDPCDPSMMDACIIGLDDTADGALEGDSLGLNDTGNTRTVFVVVDGFDTTSAGAFDLAVAVYDNSTGESCADPIDIVKADAAVAGGTTVVGGYGGFADDVFMDNNGCTNAATNNGDIVYKIDGVTAAETVTATLTPLDPDDDVAIYLTEGCDETSLESCVGSDVGFNNEAETASYQPAAPATVYIVVDAYNTGTLELHGYTLKVEIE